MTITGTISRKRRFQTRRQEGQDRVDEEESEIRFRRSLNDGGIRLSAGTERAEKERTSDDAEQDSRRKDSVFPYGVRHKRHAVFLDQLVIFALIGGFPNQTSRHGPLIDAETQHHPNMHADTRQQNARDHEDVQCKEPGQRSSADDGAAQKSMHQQSADARHTAR